MYQNLPEDCQYVNLLAECGAVRTMRQNAEYSYTMLQNERRMNTELKRQIEWFVIRLNQISSSLMDYDPELCRSLIPEVQSVSVNWVGLSREAMGGK